jgi:hypothetical protein
VLKRSVILLLVAFAADAQAAARRHAIGWPFPIGQCAPGVIANAPGVQDFALSATDVYFFDDAENLWRVPKTGGVAPTFLAHAPSGPVLWMTVDGAQIYFAAVTSNSTADLYQVPLSGGAITTVAAGVLTPFAFQIEGQFIYWISVGTPSGEDFLADGAVRRMAKSGGTVQTLASSLSFPFDLTVRGDSVYFSETGIALGNPSAGVRKVPASGGAVTKLFDGAPATSVAVDDVNAYFVLVRLGTGLVDVVRVPLAGGTPVPLVTDLDFVDGLVVQRGNLYYVAERDESGTIEAVSTTGGSPRTVKAVETAVSRLLFDDCLIYYATPDRLERAVP